MRVFLLVFWILLCQAVGLLGARWTAPEIPGWYRGLRKPSFNPPSWVFGPVWTLLYLLMAIAAWRISVGESPLRTAALTLFAAQLALNLLWSWVFFRLHNVSAAFIELVALWLAIAATLGVFSQIDTPAAWLMSPYLAWVTFAAILNAAIRRLN